MLLNWWATLHHRGITTVLRGEEWLPSTPKHELLYRAFGWVQPTWAHLPLLLGPDGSKLSKRRGNTASIAELRDAGYLPAALTHSLVLCGWAPPQAELEQSRAGVDSSCLATSSNNEDHSPVDVTGGAELFTLAGLSGDDCDLLAVQPQQRTGFSLNGVQRAAARLDPVKLDVHNGRFLRALLRLIDDPSGAGADDDGVVFKQEKWVESAAAEKERLLSLLRSVFAEAVLESSRNDRKSGLTHEERGSTTVLPVAVENALLQWESHGDTNDVHCRSDLPKYTALVLEKLLTGGKLDDYLLEVIRLLQKQANGPLRSLANEHVAYLFGHIIEQPQFECKVKLASAVVGTMEAMALALEDQGRNRQGDLLSPLEMQRILKEALMEWNEKHAGHDFKLKPGQFMPQVRMAVTGKRSGADLFPILSLLGAECVASRLRLGAAALQRL